MAKTMKISSEVKLIDANRDGIYEPDVKETGDRLVDGAGKRVTDGHKDVQKFLKMYGIKTLNGIRIKEFAGYVKILNAEKDKLKTCGEWEACFNTLEIIFNAAILAGIDLSFDQPIIKELSEKLGKKRYVVPMLFGSAFCQLGIGDANEIRVALEEAGRMAMADSAHLSGKIFTIRSAIGLIDDCGKAKYGLTNGCEGANKIDKEKRFDVALKLLKILTHRNKYPQKEREIRKAAARAIGWLGFADKAYVGFLFLLLSERILNYDEQALSISNARRGRWNFLINPLYYPRLDGETLDALAMAIARLARTNEEIVVPVLASNLTAGKTTDMRVQAAFVAAIIAQRWPTNTKLITPALITALTDPEAEVRRRSAEALAIIGPNIGPAFADAASKLLKLLESDPFCHVRSTVIWALKTFGRLTKDVKTALETAATKDSAKQVRQAATEALAKLKKKTK